MSETPKLEIYICSSCRPKDADPDDERRPGKDLAARLGAKLNEHGLGEKYRLNLVECMSVCKRPATAAIMSPGKFTYTMGDLDPETAADDLLKFAELYENTEDGVTVWRERPEQIRKGIISRTPCFCAVHERITKV